MPFEAYAPGGLTTTVRSVTKDLGGWNNGGEKTVVGPYDRYAPMLKAWADDVLRGQQTPYTPDYELVLYKLMLRCCGMEGA